MARYLERLTTEAEGLSLSFDAYRSTVATGRQVSAPPAGFSRVVADRQRFPTQDQVGSMRLGELLQQRDPGMRLALDEPKALRRFRPREVRWKRPRPRRLSGEDHAVLRK